MPPSSFFLGACVLLWTLGAMDLRAEEKAPPAPSPELIDRELFLVEPRVQQVALSPNAEHVAYLLREDYGSSVWVLDGETGRKTRRLQSNLVERLEWSLDSEGLFLIAGERIAFLPRTTGRPSFIFRPDPLRAQEYRGVDPVFPHHILVTEKVRAGEFRLLRIDTSGKAEALFRSSSPIDSFLLDRSGRVAFFTGTDGLELVLFRQTEKGEDARGEEILRCGWRRPCGFLALAKDGRNLLLLSRWDGDLWKLEAFDPELGKRRILHADPRGFADLDEVLFDPLDGAALVASYDTDGLRHYPLASGAGDHLSRLSKSFPGGELEIEARSEGRPYWLLAQTLPRMPQPRFYLYDTERQTVRPILEEECRRSVEVPRDLLVDKVPMSYSARDGRRVYGFLSLPRGVDLGEAPMVARIHGGPWNHVRQGYDSMTQFLVSRGYVVFEPNFRASTGYGLGYVLAARGEFGDGRVHQDIVDGVLHLLDRGIGDRDRMAIVGHSFGGFSALGAVAFSPEIFRVGIASAPAIDLLRALEDVDEDVGMPHGLSQRELILRMIVDPKDKGALARLHRGSPENRLADTARPLLIFAGAQDEKIALVDVQQYALALDGLGKDVSLLVDQDSGHSFRKPRLRSAYLYLLERFLAHHLGGAVQEEADPKVVEYVEANLSLTGPSLEAALSLSGR